MANWLTTGFTLLRLWTAAVGPLAALQACLWVVARKAFPGLPQLARAVMPTPRVLEVRIPGFPDPFFARWPSSDLYILHEIVRRAEYAPLADSLDPARPILFLDLGANMGDATRYFLNLFPTARALAVEPGASNAGICRRNLACLGDRAQVVEAAAWNRNTPLVFRPETTGVGTEALISLREPRPGEAPEVSGPDGVRGVDIPTLLGLAAVPPDTQIAVKIDIEGGEAALFARNLDWLNRVDRIAIELHDDVQPGCSDAFLAAVAPHLRAPTRKIGLTVFAELVHSPTAVWAGTSPCLK